MIVHEHVFSDTAQANAFICAINWVNNVAIERDMEVIFEAIDISVGTDESGDLVASAIVNEYEPDDDTTEGYIKQHIDHREHV